MRSNAYCGNLLWQSSLTRQAPDVGAEAFESYFIVTAGKWHYPVKILFVGQNGTWNVSAVDFDE